MCPEHYTAEFQRSAAFVAARQPQLAAFFHDAAAVYSEVALLDRAALAALGRLTSVSEFVYLDPSSLIPMVVGRGELGGLAAALYRLSRCGYGYAQVLLQHYPSLGAALASVAMPLLELAETCRGRVVRGERILQFCLDLAERQLGLFFARQLTTVAAASPGTVLDVVALLASRIGAGAEGQVARVRAWVETGVALFRQGRIDEGIAFFQGKSRTSRSLLGLNHCVLSDQREY